jgi:hypothetical protein
MVELRGVKLVLMSSRLRSLMVLRGGGVMSVRWEVPGITDEKRMRIKEGRRKLGRKFLFICIGKC